MRRGSARGELHGRDRRAARALLRDRRRHTERSQVAGHAEDIEVLERDEEGRARLVETVTDAMVKKARSVLRFD